jgi:hypothetical protein
VSENQTTLDSDALRERTRLKRNAYNREWKRAHPESAANSVRNWKARNKERVAEHRKAHRKRYPEKTSARNIVYQRIHDGTLLRPDQCSRCLIECKPEAHHSDYSKPLDITWLCRSCHLQEDGPSIVAQVKQTAEAKRRREQ